MDVSLHRWSRVGLVALAITVQTGCRAMSRFKESHQSIAARRLSRLGLEAAHEGQWSAAETLFAEALEVSAGDDRAHAGLAESLWQRGERDQAVEHLEHAVRLSAGDPKHVMRLGQMYLDAGRVDEANRQCLVALNSERNSADAWILRGDCLRAGGHSEEALAAYHRALALRPDSAQAQLEAAEVYYSLERYDRLLATIERLHESVGAAQAPARSDMLRGVAMRHLGRPAEARRCFARAALKDPSDPSAHLQLASLSLEEGDLVSARTSLAEAMRLDPTLPEGADARWHTLAPRPGAPPQLAGQPFTETQPLPQLRR